MSQVRIHSFLEKTKNYKRKKVIADTEDVLSKEKELLRKRVNSLIRSKRVMEAQKLLKHEETKPWGRDTQAKVVLFSEMATWPGFFFFFLLLLLLFSYKGSIILWILIFDIFSPGLCWCSWEAALWSCWSKQLMYNIQLTRQIIVHLMFGLHLGTDLKLYWSIQGETSFLSYLQLLQIWTNVSKLWSAKGSFTQRDCWPFLGRICLKSWLALDTLIPAVYYWSHGLA